MEYVGRGWWRLKYVLIPDVLPWERILNLDPRFFLLKNGPRPRSQWNGFDGWRRYVLL